MCADAHPAAGHAYRSPGGSAVRLPSQLHPFRCLRVAPTCSFADLRAVFRRHIASADRQRRAEVSACYAIAGALKSSHPLPDWARAGDDDGAYGYDASHPVFLAHVGDTRALAALLRRRPALQRQSSSGASLIYVAARAGFVDTVTELLRQGCQVNARHLRRSTVLHVAAFYGHEPVVTHLLACGVDVKAANVWGHTAADEAATDAIKAQIGRAGGNLVGAVMAACLATGGGDQVQQVRHGAQVVCTRVVRSVGNRAHYCTHWQRAWHGTRREALASIFRHGLRRPGSKVGDRVVRVPSNHIPLGRKVFGIDDWSRAVFVSPSVLYSSHPAYAEYFAQDGAEWACLVEVAVRPGTFTQHPPTVLRYSKATDEPADLELRVDEPTGQVTEDGAAAADEGGVVQILRVRDEQNVCVLAVCVVRKNFLEQSGLRYTELNAILQSAA